MLLTAWRGEKGGGRGELPRPAGRELGLEAFKFLPGKDIENFNSEY